MAEFSKHVIKCHPSITPISVHFLITAKILEPLQEISQMKKYIKVLSTKSDRHHDRLAKLEEWGKPKGWILGEPLKISRPLVNLVVQELLPDQDGSLKIGVVVAEDWPT